MISYLPPDKQSNGLTCICDGCEKQFQLTSDREDKGEGTTYIHLCSCDSGGLYDVYVECPYCEHHHDLY